MPLPIRQTGSKLHAAFSSQQIEYTNIISKSNKQKRTEMQENKTMENIKRKLKDNHLTTLKSLQRQYNDYNT
jgi:hypothetical protein